MVGESEGGWMDVIYVIVEEGDGGEVDGMEDKSVGVWSGGGMDVDSWVVIVSRTAVIARASSTVLGVPRRNCSTGARKWWSRWVSSSLFVDILDVGKRGGFGI